MNCKHLMVIGLMLAFTVNRGISGEAAHSLSSSGVVVANIAQRIPAPTPKNIEDMSIPELLDDLTRDVSKLLTLYWEYTENLCSTTLDNFKKYLATVTDINAEIERTAVVDVSRRPLPIGIKGVTVANIAIEDGHIEIIELLKKHGFAFDIKKEFQRAVYLKNKKTIEYLLKRGADINALIIFRRTPLMHAAEKGHLESVRLLIEAGAKVNIADEFGETALMYAAAAGHFEIVKYLVEKGANIDARNKNGETALKIATRAERVLVAGHKDIKIFVAIVDFLKAEKARKALLRKLKSFPYALHIIHSNL